MTLSIPKPGEVWEAGSSHYLARAGMPDARMDYSLDAGVTWREVPSDGTDRRPPADDPRFVPSTLSRLLWKAPDAPGKTCCLRMLPPSGSTQDAAVTEVRLAPSAERRCRWEEVARNWYEVPGTPWEPRRAASVFVHAGALWVAAGNRTGNACRNDVWKLAKEN